MRARAAHSSRAKNSVCAAIRAGASGFLLKDVPPEQLVAGIRAVASGDALLAPSVTRRVIEEFVRRPPDSVRTPPPKLAGGYSIARQLGRNALRPYRHHYEYIYSQVLVRLMQIYQQRNEWEEVLEYAYLALSLDPYCEPATKAIVDVYFKQGNTAMAMRRLDDFRSFLRRELGVEASKEIHALRKKIMAAGGVVQAGVGESVELGNELRPGKAGG